MNKMRVYELATEMGYSSKEFLDLLRNMGVDARSNFSVLEDPTVKTIREMLRKDGGGTSTGGAASTAPARRGGEASCRAGGPTVAQQSGWNPDHGDHH